MRKIAFEALNKLTGERRTVLSYQTQSDFFEDPKRMRQKVVVFDHPSVNAAKIKARFDTWLVKDCEIFEFTGMFDANGIPIFEGDKVNGLFKQFNVVFEEGSFFLKGENPKMLLNSAKLEFFSVVDVPVGRISKQELLNP